MILNVSGLKKPESSNSKVVNDQTKESCGNSVTFLLFKCQATTKTKKNKIKWDMMNVAKRNCKRSHVVVLSLAADLFL